MIVDQFSMRPTISFNSLIKSLSVASYEDLWVYCVSSVMPNDADSWNWHKLVKRKKNRYWKQIKTRSHCSQFEDSFVGQFTGVYFMWRDVNRLNHRLICRLNCVITQWYVLAVGMWKRLNASVLVGGIATSIWTSKWKRKRKRKRWKRHKNRPLPHP